MTPVLVARCNDGVTTLEELHDLYDHDGWVAFETFFKHVSLKYVTSLLGYAYGKEKGLHLKPNSIGPEYYRSVFRGNPCWHMEWSRIDYIFQEEA